MSVATLAQVYNEKVLNVQIISSTMTEQIMGAPAAAEPATETVSYQRLRRLLDELFQFDQADLDFGIYRIMNQKRAEIARFLDEDLLPQVRATLIDYRAGEQETLKAELDKLRGSLQAAGVPPESAPRYRELEDQLASVSGSTNLENEVYSDLYTLASAK